MSANNRQPDAALKRFLTIEHIENLARFSDADDPDALGDYCDKIASPRAVMQELCSLAIAALRSSPSAPSRDAVLASLREYIAAADETVRGEDDVKAMLRFGKADKAARAILDAAPQVSITTVDSQESAAGSPGQPAAAAPSAPAADSVVVPRKPTDAMLTKGAQTLAFWKGETDWRKVAFEVYDDMLNASLKEPAPQASQRTHGVAPPPDPAAAAPFYPEGRGERGPPPAAAAPKYINDDDGLEVSAASAPSRLHELADLIVLCNDAHANFPENCAAGIALDDFVILHGDELVAALKPNAAPRNGGSERFSPNSKEFPETGHCEAAAPGDDARDAARYRAEVVVTARKPDAAQ